MAHLGLGGIHPFRARADGAARAALALLERAAARSRGLPEEIRHVRVLRA